MNTPSPDAVDFLKDQGQNYPFLYSGQKLMWSGQRAFGACCEPLFADNVNALRIDSYSRAAFAFAAAGAAAPLIHTPAPNGVALFANGKGEPGTDQGFPAGYTMRAADTNTFPGGAPVNRGHLFWIFGVATEIESVVSFTGSPAVEGIPAWVYASPTGVGAGSYYERIYRTIAENSSITFSFLNTSVTYDMGSFADTPSMSGLSGQNLLSVGSHLVGAYIPLLSVLAVNARDESRKLTVRAIPDRVLSIDNDANNPSVAGTVYATIKMRLYGIDICDPVAGSLCGVPNGPADINALLQMLARNPQAVAAMQAMGAQQGPK